jgi:hypothetical protein
MSDFLRRKKWATDESSRVEWPDWVKFVVVTNSSVKHLSGGPGEKNFLTWCRMVWPTQDVEPFDLDVHGDLRVCGSCARTTKARNEAYPA